MNFNRMLLRAASVGMAGTLLVASPACADSSVKGLAGVSLLFQQNSAEAQGISGVAAVDYTNAAYMNARNVLAGGYTMTAEETAAQVALAGSVDADAESKKKTSPYDNIAISQVNNYVNIRTEASEDSEIVGKIYNNAAATILDTVEAEDGKWYEIESGSVEGYIKSDYFVTGAEAEAIAYEVGEVKATVSTETLRLRSEASLESSTVTLLSEDEKYEVVDLDGEFTKLRIDDDMTGYVATDYVDITVDFKKAVSLEEEREAEEARRRAEEAARESEEAEEEEYDEDEDYDSEDEDSEDEDYDSEDDEDEDYDSEDDEEEVAETKKETKAEKKEETKKETKKETTAAEEEEEEEEETSSSSSCSGTRSDIVDYALSFVGNVPYVYGGTSLSSGVDCSGFVQQVFKHFGYSLPRTSGEQGSCGKSVSSSSMQPGDLVYYGGHIAIYIGGGQVVHASNERTGIKVSTWNYRSPISIRNVIG